jgi:hypothetical protein
VLKYEGIRSLASQWGASAARTFELSGTERTRRRLLPAWPPEVVNPSSKRITPTSKSTLLTFRPRIARTIKDLPRDGLDLANARVRMQVEAAVLELLTDADTPQRKAA